jgi:hypothetical protein
MQIPLFLQQNLRFRTSLKGHRQVTKQSTTGPPSKDIDRRRSREPTVPHLPQRTSTGDEAENLRFRTSLKEASTGDEAENCGSAPQRASTGDEAETRLTIPVKNTRESFKLHAKSEMSG